MSAPAPDATQRLYARIVGWTYLLSYACSLFGAIAPSWIRGPGEFATQATRVIAHEPLYRLALVSMDINWVLIVVQAFGWYVVLAPVGRRLAQLALLMDLGHAFVGAASLMLGFGTLRVYVAAHSGAAPGASLEPLLGVLASESGSGFNTAMIFLGVASLLFFLLLYRSRYIPRALAVLGIIGSPLLALVSIGTLIAPGRAGLLQIGWAPGALAELGTGLWLAIAGIRAPAATAAST